MGRDAWISHKANMCIIVMEVRAVLVLLFMPSMMYGMHTTKVNDYR